MMSMNRINYTKNEVIKLQSVIKNLVANYEINFKKYDSEYKQVKDDFDKKKNEAEKNIKLFGDIIEQEQEFIEPLQDLKTMARFQNELILVKHYALIESMIVNTFKDLAKLLKKNDLYEKYFRKKRFFSSSVISAKEIAEITDNEILIEKKEFWIFYDIMRTIRNSIAHGDPLFIICYDEVKKFNSKINIIEPYTEKNEGSLKGQYPSLLHPTYSNESKWYCHLSNEIKGLSTLNEQSLKFIDEIRTDYIEFGEKNNIDKFSL